MASKLAQSEGSPRHEAKEWKRTQKLRFTGAFFCLESDEIRDLRSRILVVPGIEFSLPLARIFQVMRGAGFSGWLFVFGGVVRVCGIAVLAGKKKREKKKKRKTEGPSSFL